MAAYARWAASYPPHAHNPLMLAEERAVLSCLQADLRGRTVCDAGCGSGRYMLHALRRGAECVLGVDLSREMLDRARAELTAESPGQAGLPRGTAQAAARSTLLQGSIEALPLRDQSVDLTICALTIGHVPSLRNPVAELQRITRPGGVIVCSDFHPRAYARGARREFSAGGQRYAVRHTPYELSDWQQVCAALGLRILRVLEPRLDPTDIAHLGSLARGALKGPVAIVFELGR
jgi:malonyl-CoA O-methyltransferase